MKVLIAYASSEGQTRKIVRTVADQLVNGGITVELLRLADAEDIRLDRFDCAILAASVHAGHYQRSLSDFAANHASGLRSLPTLFLSVSLAAAGHNSEDWRSLERILEDFKSATGWAPGRVEQIAGAYLPSRYDILKRFVMRRILAAKAAEPDLDADKEYTDWDALGVIVDEWLKEVAKHSAS